MPGMDESLCLTDIFGFEEIKTLQIHQPAVSRLQPQQFHILAVSNRQCAILSPKLECPPALLPVPPPGKRGHEERNGKDGENDEFAAAAHDCRIFSEGLRQYDSPLPFA